MRSPARRGAALVAVLLSLAGSRCDRTEQRPSVVLVTIDTLRADHLSLYGYPRETSPNLTALARRATVFEQAISPIPETLPACAALLTGHLPARLGLRGNGRPFLGGVETLATHLSAAGYRTAAFVSGFPLVRRISGLQHGFDVYDDEMPDPRGRVPAVQRSAEKTTDAALAWLRGAGPGPFFLWLHYYDPHGDYAPGPPYDTMFPPPAAGGRQVPAAEIPEYQRLGADTPAETYVARYDGEIRRVDTQLERIFDRLDLDRTLVVISADHGESLTEHGYFFDHGNELYMPSLHVPLLMTGPGIPAKARRLADPVRLVDVYPTILDLLGRPAPEGIAGRSLLPLISGSAGVRLEALSEARFQPYRALSANADVGPKIAARDERFSVILRLDSGRVEAYDRRHDPAETRDLLQEANTGGLGRRLGDSLRRRLAAASAAGGAESRALTAELREQLERLAASVRQSR